MGKLTSLNRTTIYHRYAVAKACFVGSGYADLEVHGYLIKYQWLGMTWYRIKVYKPHVSGIWDGCYRSRDQLKSYASAVRQELKRLLYEYKYHGSTKSAR